AQAKNTRQGQAELKRVGAIKAFFINDVSRGWNEVKELKEVDQDLSGCISQSELLALRSKNTKLSKAEKIMEIFITHPNTLKRIKRLSSLS
ncbi:MAG: peptidase, partial [Methanosarcinales archaeon]|nr:peptidase [Methanosarcinales archaeon]